MPQTLLDAALAYAELGYAVFPCVSGGKTPLSEHGFQDATTDIDQIVTWWTQWPMANIGVPTRGLLVVDIDGPSNPWLAGEPEKMLDLARAPMSLTPRGGRHYIFRQPADRQWRSSTGKLAPMVDTRADGGYIVVPPSILAGELVYCWAEGMSLDAPPDRLSEPPGWLVEMLDHLTKPSQPSPDTTIGNAVPSGQRNSTLASLAGTMRRAGMGETEILAAIRATNSQRCNPPLPDVEVEQIAASIARYAPDEISVALIENHWQQIFEEPSEHAEAADGPADPGRFPSHLLEVPGFISQVVSHTVATAFRPQPVLALGAAIALQATLAGRKVRDEFNTRTNIYCLGTCQSGGGKDRAREVNKEILYQAGLEKLVGPEGLASHAGLVSAVEIQSAILFQLDEIGRLLKTLGDASRSPHLYHIVTVLMKLYTSSASVYLGDAYADTKRNKAIDQPCVSIYGTSVPKSLYDGLCYESVTDGFLSRMLVVEGEAGVAKQRPKVMPIPQSILDVAKWWGDFRPGGNLAKEHPEPAVVLASDEATAMFDALDAKADAECERLGEPLGTLWTRTVEKARKLALVYACSANHQSPAIDVDAAHWACELAEYLTRRMIYLAHQWVAEGPFDAKRKRMLRIVEAAGPAGLTRSQLCMKTRSLTVRERIEVIDALITCGDVLENRESSGGAPRVRYVASKYR